MTTADGPESQAGAEVIGRQGHLCFATSDLEHRAALGHGTDGSGVCLAQTVTWPFSPLPSSVGRSWMKWNNKVLYPGQQLCVGLR
jgi:hypothetical protein